MKAIALTFGLWLGGQPATAHADCTITMQNATSHQFAKDQGIPVQQTSIIWFSPLQAGSLIGLEGAGKQRWYRTTLASQNPCQIASSGRISKEEVPAPIQQASQFKSTIKNALYISEADYPWAPIVSQNKVTKHPTLSESQLALGIQSPLTSTGDWPDIVQELDIQMSYGFDSIHYQALKAHLLQQFSKDQIWLYKTGDGTSGERQLFLVGRRPDGYLVGLATIAVET